ncbi:MAG: bacteriocin [Lachnospiraceae bacterium]|nr:bacteriocin [Lachnospiraceae bacterium]
MSNNISELNDDELECVSGGALSLDMEDDPLYKRFTSFWNDLKSGDCGGSGMDSRTEFMSAFSQWVKDGVPENISGWYKQYDQT